MTVDIFFVFYWIKCCLGSTVMLLRTCLCAENSPYCTTFDTDDGISLLEESLADVMLSSGDVYLLLCGDLNGRTANEFHMSQSENDVFTRPVEETPTRCSEDTILNSFGGKSY